MNQTEVMEKDAWLSGVLSRPTYCLVLQSDAKKPQIQDAVRYVLSQHANEKVFIYTKLGCDWGAVSEALSQEKFYLTDTHLSLTAFGPLALEQNGTMNVRFSDKSSEQDACQVARIARDNFQYSRFHLDPNITLETANLIKASWAENFYKGQRGDRMVVAENQNGIQGFLQILNVDNDTFLIDLIAVNQSQRGKGIAKAMISFAAVNDKLRSRILVGTQLANKSSILLYQRLGFTFLDAKHIFHFHGSAGAQR